ncbi:MAG: dehalogenase [Chloroflexi bacterium]|nr:dehalogenase [Chloroflexota bacterium]
MFFVGLLFAIVLAVLITLIIVNKISVRWWEWVLFAIGAILLLFTVQNFLSSFSENEPIVAWRFLLVLGLPALIFLIIPVLLAVRRNSTAAA